MSITFIDFAEVKSSVKIEQVAEALGFDLKEKAGQLRGECIVCEKGGPRAFCITPAKERWYCFGCQTGGDSIQLSAHVQGVHPKEGAHWISEQFSLQLPEDKKKQERPKTSSEDGFQPLTYLKSDHEAVEAIGLSAEDAEKLGIGFAPRGMMKGTVAVPIRMPDGKLVGYIGITEATLPKEWKY